MAFTFTQINYRDLNGPQQEAYNFQKLSGLLADYGFMSKPAIGPH